MEMYCYEHDQHSRRLWFFRGAAAVVAVIWLTSIVIAVSGAGCGALVVGAIYSLIPGLVLVAATCALVFRPRLSVAGDEVHVFSGQWGTKQAPFRWSGVVRWRVVVSPNDEESGPAEYRNIVVDLVGHEAPVYLWDVGCEYVRAFEQYVPQKRIAVPGTSRVDRGPSP